ncbi:MAG TPA: cation diffusion facilitator family transporter [Candidatus Omnitrophota bacterium]|nr:cation diffusion facilitator family transporter [Candidatus Omnitrophota bacterium]HPS37092.1 cation diffusion facilitator family transporter [Candidatus Omnitrophota bacterium]
MLKEREKGENGTAGMIRRAARASIWGSGISFLIAVVVGIMVDSVTLILDASASLAIFVSALLMHFSAKKIHAPPDDTFHYGYHKYETLTSVIQRALIMVTCVISIKFAVQDILHAEEVTNYALPAVAMFFSGLLSLGVTVYLKWVSKRVPSQMVRASVLHWLSDAVLSLGVCAGFVLGFFIRGSAYAWFSPYIDPVMAITLAGCLSAAPLKELFQDVLELLDAAPPREVRDKVQAVVDLYSPRVSGTHRVRTRKAGQKLFVETCFLERETLTLGHAEELAGAFEKDLRSHFPDCDVVVHFKSRR